MRRALIIGLLGLVFAGTAEATTYLVTTGNDGNLGTCATGQPCTLRDAINRANLDAAADTILLTTGGIYAQNSPYPPLLGPVTIDGQNLATLRGPGIAAGTSGLTILASNSVVRRVRIEQFTAGVFIAGGSGSLVERSTLAANGYGVLIVPPSSGNRVERNTIGCKTETTVGCRNEFGVWVESPGNVIGGDSAGAGNLISGNGMGAGARYGVVVIGRNAVANAIQGNTIGLDEAGTTRVPNKSGGVYVGGTQTLVGGASETARNVISGNGTSAPVAGIVLVAGGNTVAGNYIGVNAAGTASATNLVVGIEDISGGNTIGGSVPGAGNVVSGNSGPGIRLSGRKSSVRGNIVGLDASGTARIGNTLDGIFVSGTGNVIGGTAAAERNVISGNSGSGVNIDALAKDTVLHGNYIGLNAAGDAAVRNQLFGVWTRADGTVVGGTATGAGNVISGNVSVGVAISGSKALVQGNLIGTNAEGLAAVPNQAHGVQLGLGTKHVIGGSVPAARNVISGNGKSGVNALVGGVIAGNYIGVDRAGEAALPNGDDGVTVYRAASVTVGGTTAGAGNVISGNTRHGVFVGDDPYTTRIAVSGNFIGTNATGDAAVPNGGDGIRLLAATSSTIGGSGFAANLVSGNTGSGIHLAGGATRNTIAGNLVGWNAARSAFVPNGLDGLRIDGATGNTIGGTGGKSGPNVFAGNLGAGVNVLAGEDNPMAANSWLSNGGLGIDLGGDGRTANDDPGDADSGPNTLQNYPVLSAPVVGAKRTTITGTLSTAPGNYTIAFYASPAEDAGDPEGRTFLGTAQASSKTGTAPFTFLTNPLPAGTVITAIAIGGKGNASEFSDAVVV